MAVDDAGEFLKRLGMVGKDDQSAGNPWHEIVRPSTCSIIFGYKGKGKSALAYWLCEEMAEKHNLLPVVVNLPRDRQNLLPETFVIKELADMPKIGDAVILIDEGTTMLPAGGARLEEMVKGYVALSRQRNQIILFIFHASADVGSRILRGVDAILLKEPSQRQIQHGSKDNWWRDLLTEAKEKFKALSQVGANPRAYTFVDCEEPEFRAMLQNPLPSFWSEDLSKAWAGVDILSPDGQLDLFGKGGVKYGRRGEMGQSPQRRRIVTEPYEIERRPPEFLIEPRYTDIGTLVGFTILDPEGDVIRKRSDIVKLLHEQYPEVSVEELDNSAISYFEYRAEVDLRKR